MKILIIFFTILVISKSELSRTYDCIRNVKFEREILKQDINGAYQMAIDHNTNTLFFSYAARTNEYFKIARLNLKTQEFGIVTGIPGGFANAVDNLHQIVYMGGENGIYKYDYSTKKAMYTGFPKEKTNIWQMFYNDGLYYSTYPDEKTYLYKNGDVTAVPGVEYRAMTIAVGKTGNIYYANTSGLFVYDKDSHKTVKKDDSLANGYSTDISGNLYFSSPDGIYFVNEKEDKIEKILNVDNCYGVAIEATGNIIISQEESITRLKRTNEDCIVELKEHVYKK